MEERHVSSIGSDSCEGGEGVALVRQLIEKADPVLELTVSAIHEASICLFERSQHDIIDPRSDRVPFDTHRKNPTTTFRLVPRFKSGADGNRIPSKGHAREAEERFDRPRLAFGIPKADEELWRHH